MALLAVVAGTATAHEFWMVPARFHLQAPGSVPVSLMVGEQFEGERVGIHAGLVASFRGFSSTGTFELAPTMPAQAVGEWPLALSRPGTYLLALDTYPSSVILSADKFHAYLHEEGLDFIIKAREAAGTASAPARERYRRNVKALVQVGEQRQPLYSRRTGQRLEIVALSDPTRLGPDGRLDVEVLFDGKPLAAALVKFWHRKDGQLLTIRVRTQRQGRASATLPWPGTWMASVVHMTSAPDPVDFDWDSYWASLTFQVAR